MIKWLFFDLGSTLLDETQCTQYRIDETLKQENAPSKDAFYREMEEIIKINRLPYKDTVKKFGLNIVKWPTELEKIYSSVPEVLSVLSKKYNLGIIANQSIGTESRLVSFGIRSYFDVIISSAEEGIAKPDKEIFQLALDKAGCTPEEAYMIGDRLDNDIEPAARMGFHTIWVKQGWFAKGNINLLNYKPDIIVLKIEDILKYL